MRQRSFCARRIDITPNHGVGMTVNGTDYYVFIDDETAGSKSNSEVYRVMLTACCLLILYMFL